MERKLSSKGIILDICSMRSRAKKLLEKDSEYNKLIEVMTDKDYYNNESLAVPTLKDLAQKADISYTVARRLLDEIYSELCSYELTDTIPFEFNNTSVRFGITGIYNHVTLLVNGLKTIPRKGETVQIPFFKELTGTNYFYVDKVYHEFEDNKHEIYISLKYGSFNSYWDLRKDQAEETREISMHDATTKSDYELKKLLELKPGNAW